MSARALFLGLALALWPQLAPAQSFAGMGSAAEGFRDPVRGVPFSFPRDHGAHPDYRIEWWYVTANLTGADGRDYGIQWTLFRTATAPPPTGGSTPPKGWQTPQIWMGHAAATTPDAHYVAERFARGGIGQAGVTAAPFEAWIDEWSMRGPDLNSVRLSAQGETFGYTLDLEADAPFVAQGDNGYSVKSAAGQASYYYSQPFYAVRGRLDLPSGPVEVTGQAWLDREWSSQPLSENQTGWDWFSLSFDSGEKMMGFRLRQAEGEAYSSATWIAPDGTPTPLDNPALTATPLRTHDVAGRSVPTRWRVELPARGLDVTVEALNDDAWMDTAFPYWEGPVTVTGSHSGTGYLEMTGYE
ncbi:MAG: iron ABC transporter permease [Paracoccaceae bacterium]